MRRVYKYELNYSTDEVGAKWEVSQTIILPIGAKILKVDMQNGKLVLWALVNPELDISIDFVNIEICIVGTGHNIDIHKFMFYVDTFYDRSLVMHVFSNYNSNHNPI